MNAMISPDDAKASGSLCGNGKSGSRTDQFGNWNFSPSQRSLLQRSAMRCRSSTTCARLRCLSRWLIVSPAWPPPITSVLIRSTGIAGTPAPGGGFGRGADDPAAEGGKIALLGAEAAIDQVPAHVLGHAQRKRRHQPARREVVVDIGADAHGDAEAVDRGLQRLAVELEFGPARADAGDTGGLQPGRPIVRRMCNAQQGRSLQVAGTLQGGSEPGRAD